MKKYTKPKLTKHSQLRQVTFSQEIISPSDMAVSKSDGSVEYYKDVSDWAKRGKR